MVEQGAARPEAGTRRRLPTPPRWAWSVLVLLGWVCLLAVVMLRPGGAIGANRTEGIPQGVAPLPPLQPGVPVLQHFTSRADGLSTVDVRFGTYGGSPTCEIRATVLDPGGTALATRTRSCASIADAQLTQVIGTRPLAGTADEQLTLEIERLGSGGPLTLFGTPPSGDLPAATTTSGTTEPLAVELHTGYGNDARAYDQVGTALRRIGDFGPFWTRPVAVVLIALGVIALTAGLALAPWRAALVMLVLLALLKGLLWAVVLPTFQGADEPAHVAYAQYMAVEGAIPKRDHPANDLGFLGPEIEVGISVFRQPYVARSDRADYGGAVAAERARLQAAADGPRGNNGAGAAAGYPPHYYAVPALIDKIVPGTIDVRVGAMRLWSVLLGAIAVGAAALTGRRLFPRHESAALLLGVAVAFQPMLSQQTATVTNDALLIASGAVCLLAAVALAAPGRSRWWTPVAAAALGVGLLAKPLALVFVPVLAVAWIAGRWRSTERTPWVWEAATAAGALAVTYGTWFLYAALFGFAGVGIQPRPTTGPTTLHAYLSRLRADDFARLRVLWTQQFWGNFAWVDVPFPAYVYDGIGIAVLLGLLAVAWWVVRTALDARSARRGEGPLATAAGLDLAVNVGLLVLAVATTVVVVHILDFDYFRQTGLVEFAQGRYALLVVPAVLALPALLLRRAVPRLSPVVPMAVVAAAMVVLNVWGLALLTERFYL